MTEMILAALALVTGLVVDENSHAPIAGARVQFIAAFPAVGSPVRQGMIPQTTTDTEGSFALDVVPGRYHVVLDAGGYIPAEDPAGRLPPDVDVTDAGAQLHVMLARAGAIAGRLTDPEGRPLPNAAVLAERRTSQRVDSEVAPSWSRTNANGEFRLSPLHAGQYHVRADAKAVDRTFATTYYGEKPDVRWMVHVHPGVTTGDVVFAMREAHGYAVSGRVLDEKGQAVPAIEVSLIADPRFDSVLNGIVSTTDAEGVFTFGGVVPGRYVVSATRVLNRSGDPAPAGVPFASVSVGVAGPSVFSGPMLSGTAFVTVDAVDVTEVSIVVHQSR